MATLISRTPEETLALGEAWGRAAQPGWLIGLSGELGAGKTQLVKGLARGLSVTETVRSPTFALMHDYTSGRLPLVHLDLYRLDTPAQIAGAGLEDYLLQPRGVTVVEWIERWLGAAGDAASPIPGWLGKFRRVRIEAAGETERRITYEDFGA